MISKLVAVTEKLYCYFREEKKGEIEEKNHSKNEIQAEQVEVQSNNQKDEAQEKETETKNEKEQPAVDKNSDKK